ncbi:MAG: cyclic nucleotide-binding domain-containing protein [Verrucomicrobia bacterium]|nr:cyclic nucleotide-binding domain-containing protein [Verrucomicrobiota bacterium]
MSSMEGTALFRVWGADHIAYGPVELPALIEWAKEERVRPESWVFLQHENRWVAAREVSELALFFPPATDPGLYRKSSTGVGAQLEGLRPNALRRLRVLADLEPRQLESFLEYLEVCRVRQFGQVVRRGEHGDAMYLVLEGEVRALIMIDGKETTLATMGVGEFFGEISLLDQGPRSADIVANTDTVLLKLSAAAFNRIVREAPALATPFLLGIARYVVTRMRSLTKRYEDSIHLARMVSRQG